MTPPDVYELILRRCEYVWKHGDSASDENDRLMPIILELIEIAKERGEALECVLDSLRYSQASLDVTDTLAATSERLNKLGKAE
jgi:hypothetical protein